MSLVLGTLSDYLANGGTYTTNPPAAYGGPTGVPAAYQGSTENQNGYIRGQWNEFTPNNCGCGQPCVAWVHEAITDWWFPFFYADCGGQACFNISQANCAPGPVDAGYLRGTYLNRQCANYIDPCDPCNDPYKTSFEDMARFTADQDFGSGTVKLANLFPGQWLVAFNFNPFAFAKLDDFAVSCQNDIILVSLEWTIPAGGGRPFQTITKPPPPLPGGGHVGFTDPPLPRFVAHFLPREIPAVGAMMPALSSSVSRVRPPAMLAPESPAFARPNFGAPLPIFPALSRHAIEEVCGVCGDTAEAPVDEYEL